MRNFGYYADDENRITYQDGGRLCRMNLKTGKVHVLLEDETGAVRDPQVHYDAERIIFSYRPGGTEYYHLYEINVDGSGLRQLTDGPYDDIEPTYLAGGDIVFVSSRCKRWVNCWFDEGGRPPSLRAEWRRHPCHFRQPGTRQHALAAS